MPGITNPGTPGNATTGVAAGGSGNPLGANTRFGMPAAEAALVSYAILMLAAESEHLAEIAVAIAWAVAVGVFIGALPAAHEHFPNLVPAVSGG